MSNKITETFKNNKKAFIPFITAGYPDNETFINIIKIFDKIGVGFVEIGIPFSDPLADGPVIQESSQYVLDKGINIDTIFDLTETIRDFCSIPIVFMTYYNIITHYGIKRFVEKCVSVGVDGLIIPDLPPEEADLLLLEAKGKIAITFLVSTISKVERVKYITDKTTGFIYFVSRLGVTGKGMKEADNIKNKVMQLKKNTKLPVCVGFGVSDKDDAKRISEYADGVIVGSAIIDFIKKNKDSNDFLDKFEEFCVQFIL